MKALLYRPVSKRPLAIAFAAAAAIHISALAFSPGQRLDVVSPGDVTDVEIEPGPAGPEVTPEPQPIEQVARSTIPPNEFVEPAQPIAPRMVKPARPIPSHSTGGPARLPFGNIKALAISAPRPAYPYEARLHHITGSGVITLDVDSPSGSVLNATVTQSTGSPILDNSAKAAFQRWRFKSGTASRVRIPVTFTMFGAQF